MPDENDRLRTGTLPADPRDGLALAVPTSSESVPSTPESVATGSKPILVSLADVEAVPVRWLWKGRIPLGKITILDGDPGVSKSLFAIELAARISRGLSMPDDTKGDVSGPAGVVLVSYEDDIEDTIRPRLDAAGGDPLFVVAFTGVSTVEKTKEGNRERIKLPSLLDIESMRTAIKSTNAKLLIVDPFAAALAGTDSYVDSEIRELLAPLAALAAETGVAVLLVRHLRKSRGGNPLYAGGGSIGIIGAARAGLLIERDPDDPDGKRRVLCMTKCNLAEEAPSLGYEIKAVNDVPKINWLGRVEHTASSLMAACEDRTRDGALVEAEDFLREILATGSRPVEDVKKDAKAAAISQRTLERAKSSLKVKSSRNGFAGNWLWTMPNGGSGS